METINFYSIEELAKEIPKENIVRIQEVTYKENVKYSNEATTHYIPHAIYEVRVTAENAEGKLCKFVERVSAIATYEDPRKFNTASKKTLKRRDKVEEYFKELGFTTAKGILEKCDHGE